MSVASRARTQMTMRAQVQRNSTATVDVDGHPAVASWANLGSPIACRVWSRVRRYVDDNRKTALLEDLRLAVALDADVTALDRVSQVTDRLGVVLWAGPFRLLVPQHKHTHVEWSIERITST